MVPFIPLHFLCAHFWQLVHCIELLPTPNVHKWNEPWTQTFWFARHQWLTTSQCEPTQHSDKLRRVSILFELYLVAWWWESELHCLAAANSSSGPTTKTARHHVIQHISSCWCLAAASGQYWARIVGSGQFFIVYASLTLLSHIAVHRCSPSLLMSQVPCLYWHTGALCKNGWTNRKMLALGCRLVYFQTRLGPWSHVLDGVQIPPPEGTLLRVYF